MTTGNLFRAAAAVLLAGVGLGLMRSFGSLHLPSVLIYSGIVIFCAGLITAFLPKRWSGFSHRLTGTKIGLLGGGALVAIAWLWPVQSVQIAVPVTKLDAFLPVYDFHERHEISIQAPVARVRETLNQISFADVGVMEALARIRSIAMGQFHPPTSQGAPLAMPILQMVNDPRSGFFPLDDTPREVVFGLAGAPWRNYAVRVPAVEFSSWHRPDCVKVGVNVLLEDLGNGRTLAVTETRVQASDASARRKMAHYWTLVYPGTGMVRVGLLRAIRSRAERQ